MSNAMHGENPDSEKLLKMLDLDTEKYPIPRFRDIFVKKNGKQIILYTRTGGLNRNHDSTEKKQKGKKCPCHGCIITFLIPQHPLYISDYDDSFDPTYAFIEYLIPKESKAEALTILSHQMKREKKVEEEQKKQEQQEQQKQKQQEKEQKEKEQKQQEQQVKKKNKSSSSPSFGSFSSSSSYSFYSSNSLEDFLKSLSIPSYQVERLLKAILLNQHDIVIEKSTGNNSDNVVISLPSTYF
jgi:flagellar biosynthesis GTPase FlhF